MRKTPFLLGFTTVLLLNAVSAWAQWTNVAPKLLAPKPSTDIGGAMMYSSGRLWAGLDEKVWMSEDEGITWNDRTPTYPTFSTPRDIDFFDANNGVLSCSDGIYITRDGGNNWRYSTPGFTHWAAKFISSPEEIVVASAYPSYDPILRVTRDGGATWSTSYFGQRPSVIDVEANRNGIIRALYADGYDSSYIITSIDYGTTWSFSASGFDYDCFSFAVDPCNGKRIYVMNEELYTPTDHEPSIYISPDLGGSWQRTLAKDKFYFCGSIHVAPAGTVFVQTLTDGILHSIDHGLTWQNIGGPSGFKDSRTLTYKDDNTVFAMDTDGSIWRTTNGGGFPLTNIPIGAAISTDPTFSTDTLGGLVSVPIRIIGLDMPREIELTVSFDTNLEYIGTTSLSGLKVDIPGTRTKNSSRIRLPASEVKITGISAYANFNVFVDSVKKSTVSFGDLNVLDRVVLCDFSNPTSTITGPSGCGIKILSDFLRYNKTPQFRIYPNPANSTVTIAYGEHAPNPSQEGNKFEINVVDALGTIRLTQHAEISAEKNAELDLGALPSGIYFIRIRGEGILTALPISLQK
jgi:photosystem II stability/assembly factor-like uncharacterized protein